MPDTTRLSQADYERHSRRLQQLSRLLDEAIRVPGTRFRFGLDALIGLIPGVGDAAGALIGGYLIWHAHKLGAPSGMKWTMARNVGVDALLGLIPVIGDASDFVFRSNKRNLALLSQHVDTLRPHPEPEPEGAPRWLRGVIVALFLAAVALIGYSLAA